MVIKKYIAFLTLIIFIQNTATADEVVKAGDLVLTSAWGRASTSIKRPGAIYLSIKNNSSDSDWLIAAQTPAAKRAELHRHFVDNGVMKMRQIKAIEIPATEITLLKPGSFHIMLFELKSLLKKGDALPLSLTFVNAGKVTIKAHVVNIGSRKPDKKSGEHIHKKIMGHKKLSADHIDQNTSSAK